jgi:uncharacterized protein
VSAVRRLLVLMMLLGLGTAASGAEVAIPPSPAHWATDTAHFLTPQTVVALDARLHAYQDRTGHQVLVYVAPTTGTTPTEEWTVRAFQRWKVGRKGMDDGLILFVFPTDHKVRIEVGYGLEQTVPDATAARIIRDLTPKLKAGRPDEAVTTGIDEILAVIGGGTRAGGNGSAGKNDEAPSGGGAALPVPPDAGSNRIGEVLGESVGILIGLLVVAGIVVLIVKLPDPPKGRYIRSSRSSGSLWGIGFEILGDVAGGLASGGFSGGGGMSGGGGATGSW